MLGRLGFFAVSGLFLAATSCSDGSKPAIAAAPAAHGHGLTIGTQTLSGEDPLELTFSTGALAPGPGGVVGRVRNGLGRDLSGCTVTIRAVGEGAPPVVVGGMIAGTPLIELADRPGVYRARFASPIPVDGVLKVSLTTKVPEPRTASPMFAVRFEP